MDEKVFRERIYECLEAHDEEVRWQIENAIKKGICNVCDETEAGAYEDVKSILYSVLEDALTMTVGKPFSPRSVRRFNKIRKKFKWQMFH